MTDGRRTALWLAPALAAIGALVFGGLGLAVLRSLGLPAGEGMPPPGLGAYARVLADPDLLPALAYSLRTAAASTALALVLGLAVALLLRRPLRGGGALRFLVQANLTVPHVVAAVGMMYLLGQSGLLARLAFAAGVIDGPAGFPALLHDRWGIGVVLHYVWKEVPFVALVMLAQMQALGADHEAVARSLGASRGQAFRLVLLPQLRPGLAASGVVSFAFAFGAYEVPALLGASYPRALPVLAWQRHTDPDIAARPEAAALAVLIALVAGLAVWGLRRTVLPRGAR